MSTEPNTFLVQLRGPFKKDESLLEKIELEKTFIIHDSSTEDFQRVTENLFIKKIGIQITPESSFEAQVSIPELRHEVQIGKTLSNEDTFVIGATGMLEMNNLALDKNNINYFYFKQDENELTIVDLVLEVDRNDSEGGK